MTTYTLTLLAQGPAFAELGNLENDGTDYEGRIVVITDSRGGNWISQCGKEFREYKCVIINPSGGPAIVTTIGITPSVEIWAGDRFDISTPLKCNGRFAVQLSRK